MIVRQPLKEAELSFSQQNLWVLDQLNPGNPAFNRPTHIRITGPLNVEALERSLNALVQRHEILRTRFVTSAKGTPMQKIEETISPISLAVEELEHLSADEQAAQLREKAIAQAHTTFDLTTLPLLKAALVRLNAPSRSENSVEEHLLLLTFHHVVFDGWSNNILLSDLAALYRGFAADIPLALPPLPIQYADFARWQQQQLETDRMATQLNYWKKQLSGQLPILELPTDRPRRSKQSTRGGEYYFRLPQTLKSRLLALAKQENATLFIVLLTSFKTLLHRYTQAKDIIVGAPIAGRNAVETESLIGLFFNTLALRTQLAGQQSFRSLLVRVRQVALEAFANQDVPLPKLVETLSVTRDLSQSTLFQVLFQFKNLPSDAYEVEDVTFSECRLETDIAGLDLAVEITEQTEGLSCLFRYDASLFDAATMRRMGNHFLTLLESIVADPQQQLHQLTILPAAEKQQLLDWSRSDSLSLDAAEVTSIHRLFELQVVRSPHAPAVVFKQEKLSYHTLNQRANQLARHLKQFGVAADVPVGIYLERSPNLLVALLAVLKAGGAYVPLDAETLPMERVEYILADTRSPIVITESALAAKLSNTNAQLLCIDNPKIAQEETDNSTHTTDPSSLAYIIYTSGSTGQPKGTMVEHHSAVNAFYGWNTAYKLPQLKSHLQLAGFSFDVFTGDWIRALCSGAQLVICPTEMKLEPAKLYKLMQAEQIDCAEFIPAVIRLLVQHLKKTEQSLDDIKLLIVGSDTWYVWEYRHLKAFCGPQTRLVNSYGLTEDTIDSSFFEGSTEQLSEESLVPIGRPFANKQLYVVDKFQQLMPIGIPGELYVGGAGLARGYLNRPNLTAERFISPSQNQDSTAPLLQSAFPHSPLPTPYSPTPPRLYKTGDRARYLPDGNIEFLGRQDFQIKIRGFRIELGEIENALLRHAQVKETVVVVRQDQNLERLVAYLVGEALEASEVYQFLKGKLPDYMLPSAFVLLPRLPLTPSGKVDRRALPEPDPSQRIVAEAFVAPSTPVEQTLASIWCELLQLERVGIHDNFFELGGHSLLATQVTARVLNQLAVELPLITLFEQPTIAQIAQSIAARLEKTSIADDEQALLTTKIPKRDRTHLVPASFAQQRWVFLQQLEPDSRLNNLPKLFKLRRSLSPVTVKQALETVIERHEVLRTTFRLIDGKIFQVINQDWTLAMPTVDLSALPQSEVDTALKQVIHQAVKQPFDLSQDLMLRCQMIDFGRGEHTLLMVIHHIATDHWMIDLMLNEITLLCEAIEANQPAHLPVLPIQYADFSVWQHQQFQQGYFQKQLDYWAQKLSGPLPVLHLPTDRPRPQQSTHRGQRQKLMLPDTLTAELKRLGQQQNATLFMTLLAAFKVLLYRYTQQTDIIVGVPISDRRRQETENLFGCFLNTLAFRTEFSAQTSFETLLKQVRTVALEAYEHQDCPLEKVMEQVKVDREANEFPLFNVMFDYINTPQSNTGSQPRPLTPVKVDRGTSMFDLTLYLEEKADGFQILFEYSAELFETETIARISGHFQTLLESIVANPTQAIDRLSLMTTAEQHQLVTQWNDTQTDYPRGKCVHQLFEEQVASSPNAVALIYEEQTHEKQNRIRHLTYQALNQRANQLATVLKAHGLAAGNPVALYMERSPEMIVSTLAILKAGGTYVPLDTSYPQKRIAFILRDSQVPILLTQSSLASQFVGAVPTLIEVDTLDLSQAATDNLLNATTSDQLAYIMYTSGSTGKPKGVCIPHRGVARLVKNTNFSLMSADDVFLQLAPIAFDAATIEIWGALLNGGQLVLFPDKNPTPKAIVETVNRHQVTFLFLTAGLFHLTIEHGIGEMRSLRQLLSGGDVLSVSHINRALQQLPNCPITNAYGPTENTVVACRHIIDQPLPIEVPVPIGHPISNTQVYILDSQLQPVPIGVQGELCITGDGIATGYLNRPTLTKEKFVENPFVQTGLGNDLLYKTGDAVRYRPDGNIEFLGRLDNQVKIRGFRIELAEITTALERHSQVEKAVVIVQEDASGDKRLTAYITAEGAAPTASMLYRFLKRRLPTYMVPSAFLVLDELPLTANGKVDRRALPQPETIERDIDTAFIAPQTAEQQRLSHIWCSLLKIDKVGIHDNFFELGGHSLLATQVISRIRTAFKVELPLRVLFESPTIADLATELADALAKPPHGIIANSSAAEVTVISPVSRNILLPLSSHQQRLWVLDQIESGITAYSMNRALRMTGPLNVTALAQSLSQIIERHEVLRTTFANADNQPIQVIHPAKSVSLEVVEIGSSTAEGQKAEDKETEARRRILAFAQQPFDLQQGP
ncbi:MAG: amino acid adenylation domain-containing protein [Cyanobacteria bacterium J06649_4]